MTLNIKLSTILLTSLGLIVVGTDIWSIEYIKERKSYEKSLLSQISKDEWSLSQKDISNSTLSNQLEETKNDLQNIQIKLKTFSDLNSQLNNQLLLSNDQLARTLTMLDKSNDTVTNLQSSIQRLQLGQTFTFAQRQAWNDYQNRIMSDFQKGMDDYRRNLQAASEAWSTYAPRGKSR